MTANKAIEIIDGLRPNSYGEEDKFRWISDLDGKVKRLVFQWNEKYIKELKAQRESGELTEEKYNELMDKTKPYAYPDDMDKELLIPTPFDDVYTLYLAAMIDFYNREYGNYNNSAMMFEERFSEYKKAYIREHRAKE